MYIYIFFFILFSGYMLNYFYKYPEILINIRNKIVWNFLYYYTILSEYYNNNIKSKKQYINCFYNLQNNNYVKSKDISKLNENSIVNIIDEINEVEYYISIHLYNNYKNNIQDLIKKLHKNEKIIGGCLTLSYKDKVILDEYDCLDLLQSFYKINISLYNLVLFIINIRNMNNINEFDDIKLEILNNNLEINEFKYKNNDENSNAILNFEKNE